MPRLKRTFEDRQREAEEQRQRNMGPNPTRKAKPASKPKPAKLVPVRAKPPSRPEPADPGRYLYLYFIQRGDGGPIKIGFTSVDPWTRMSGLQVNFPDDLALIGIFPIRYVREERLVHAILREHYIRGEWFRPHQEVLHFIRLHSVPWDEAQELAREGFSYFEDTLENHKRYFDRGWLRGE